MVDVQGACWSGRHREALAGECWPRLCATDKRALTGRRTPCNASLSVVVNPAIAVARLYRVAQKMAPFFWYALSSSNINRFSKFFDCQNQEKMCNNTITKDPTTPQVCRYTTLWNVRLLKATIENKTTSVSTHFKKLTTGNNVFIVSVIVSKVAQLSHLQFLHQNCSTCPPCCWKTHSSRRRHWPMARSMKRISQGSVTTHLRCGGIFSDSVIANFLLILTVKEFWKSVNIWWT